MAAISLPLTPAPRMLGARLFPPPRELSSETGEGTDQRIAGFQRWIFDFELPPMTYEQALDWEALFSSTDTLIMPIHEPGLTLPSYGTPLVAGAAQSGSTLNVDGLGTAEIIKGKWLSVVTSVRRYVYRTTAAVTPTAGAAALSIRPMIRAAPADNDVIELAAPKVEGFVSFEGMTVSVDKLVHGVRFSIREVR